MHSSFPKSHYSTGDALVLNNETACTEQTNKSDCHALTVNSVNKCVFRKKKCQILDEYSQTVVRELLEVCEQILKGPSNPIDLTQFTHLFEEESPPTLVKDLPVPIPFDPFNVMGLRNDVVGKYCHGESFDGDDTWSNRVNEALYALGIHFIQQNKPVHGKAKKWKPVFRDCVLGLDESIPFYARVLFVKVASEQIVTVLAGEGDNKADRLSELLFEQYGMVTQIAKADEEQEEESGTVHHIRSSRGIPNLMTLLLMILAVLNPTSAQALEQTEMKEFIHAYQTGKFVGLKSSPPEVNNFSTALLDIDVSSLNRSSTDFTPQKHEVLNALIKGLGVKVDDGFRPDLLVYYLPEESMKILMANLTQAQNWIMRMSGKWCIENCLTSECIFWNTTFINQDFVVNETNRTNALTAVKNNTTFSEENAQAVLHMSRTSNLSEEKKLEFYCAVKLAEDKHGVDNPVPVCQVILNWAKKNPNSIEQIDTPKEYTFIQFVPDWKDWKVQLTAAAVLGYVCYKKFETKDQQVSSFLRYAVAQAVALV